MYLDYDKFDTSSNNRASHVAWLRLHHYIHQQFKLIDSKGVNALRVTSQGCFTLEVIYRKQAWNSPTVIDMVSFTLHEETPCSIDVARVYSGNAVYSASVNKGSPEGVPEWVTLPEWITLTAGLNAMYKLLSTKKYRVERWCLRPYWGDMYFEETSPDGDTVTEFTCSMFGNNAVEQITAFAKDAPGEIQRQCKKLIELSPAQRNRITHVSTAGRRTVMATKVSEDCRWITRQICTVQDLIQVLSPHYFSVPVHDGMITVAFRESDGITYRQYHVAKTYAACKIYGALKMVYEYRSSDTTDYEPHKEGCLFVMTPDRFEVTEDIDLSALSFYIGELLSSRYFNPKPVPFAVYQKCAAEFKLAQKLLDIRTVYSNNEMHALTNILTLSEPGVPLSMLAPHPVAYALPGVRTAYEGNEGV